MKKTISINISGVVFNIEEDAYEVLRRYLDTISGYFTDSDGRDEIMTDIESRIAELFQERLHDGKNVVGMTDVDQVIDIMGRPEDYLDEDADAQDMHSGRTARRNGTRRLYRDDEKGMVGGVCAGISHYLGWDPIWIRLALAIAILSFGVGIPLYILLWIIIPAAHTTAEKLEMVGEPVNVDNIKKKVHETFNALRSDLDTDFQVRHAGEQFRKGGNLIVDILKRLVRFLGRFLGFFFLIGGLALAAFLIYSYFDGSWLQGGTSLIGMELRDMKDLLFTGDVNAYTFLTGLALFTLIPLVSLILLGVWLLFSVKTRSRALAPTMFGLWIIGLVMLVISGLALGKEFAVSRYTSQRINIEPASDVLFVEVNDDTHFSNSYPFSRNPMPNELIELVGDNVFCGYPQLRIVLGLKDKIEIEIEREGRGFTPEAGLVRAEGVTYNHQMHGDTLSLDPFFSFPLSNKFRAQSVEVILRIPKGQKIFLGDRVGRILYDVRTMYDLETKELVGKEWVMTNEGLMDVQEIEDLVPDKAPESIQSI